MFDESLFFDMVRHNPFEGQLTQGQVDGLTALLATWREFENGQDLRWLAYCLATAFWETGQTMQPIEEYGKGQGYAYGETDPETGQAYYGRGYVQLTWRDNYARADQELALDGDTSCEWHAENALDPVVAAAVLFAGMIHGWFRGDTLEQYFNDTTDDPYNAREIVNGDKHIIPDWSGGMSIGRLIESYHLGFLDALVTASEAQAPLLARKVVTGGQVVYRLVISGEGVFTVSLIEEE
jgi:putative chitinase